MIKWREHALKQFLVIDVERCTGCRNCELACSMRNVRSFNPARSRIQILKRETQNLIIPVVCLQCDTPLCKEACPVGALVMNSVGVLTVDDRTCIGCLNCVSACIYGGIAVDAVTRKTIKCDLCDGAPACIEACDYNAISLMSANEQGKSERSEKMMQLIITLGVAREEVQ